MAAIHDQLEADCIYLGRFVLCHLLLMNDRNYPWFILVPDREDIREIYQLERADRTQLMDESCRLSDFLMRTFDGEKLNLAALGNQVPQLHLHHVVRYVSDPAWPAPVWGKVPALPYDDRAVDEIRSNFVNSGLEGYEAVSGR
ncbi:MAG: HIT domain-containing protein [Gammaproteobacteria bacterium]|nr:HIT domain-containing protein [Gammaproteobacteria bacterium]MDH3859877.1 HIT domain-containing protein [Gammaproteobacteria bacterium]